MTNDKWQMRNEKSAASALNFLFIIFHLSLFIVTLAAPLYAVELSPNPVKVTPGMEITSWTLEVWGNSGSADRAFSNGQRLLKLIFTGGEKEKAAYKHLTNFGMAANGKLRVQIYAPDENPPKVSLALSTTLAYKWHESKPRSLKQGWNSLEFSVGKDDWKTEASGWKFAVDVEKIDDIRAVDVIVANGKQEGVIYLQGVHYDLDTLGEKIASFIKDMQSEDAEKRDLAEKALVAAGRPALEALHQIEDNDRPEVLLRAASAIRQIEAVPEEKPADPKILEALEKQREEQSFEEARRRAQYILHGLETERQRLAELVKDAQADLELGREALKTLKFTDPEKRKAYEETLNKLDAMLKEVRPPMKTNQ